MDESTARPAPDSERARQAEVVIATPGRFKICEACDSIVSRRVATCPNCYGYRFNTSKPAIVEQARLLGSRERTSVTAEDML